MLQVDVNKEQGDVVASITIGKDVSELYPQFLDVTSRFLIAGELLGASKTLESGINSFIQWESAEDAPFQHRGYMYFKLAPADWGTEVRMVLKPTHEPTLIDKVKAPFTSFTPKVAAGKVLRRFKALAEVGEVPALIMNPSTRNNVEEK